MLKNSFPVKKIECKVYLAVWMVVVVFAAIINHSNPFYFTRFLGKTNPLLAISFSGIMGFVLISILLYKRGFVIFYLEYFKKTFRHIWLIILFTSIAIMVDCTMGFPKDMNIPFPESLLFYPAIAFLVEIVFHVLPITMVLFFLTAIFKTLDRGKVIWICIFLVALIEPTFQIMMDDYPVWALIVVWVNLYLFNLTQLFQFKNYGFISMYCFRLIYYLIWHIVWGHFRLDLLF